MKKTFFLVPLMWAIFGLVFVIGKEALNYFYFLDFVALRAVIVGGFLLCYNFLVFPGLRNQNVETLKKLSLKDWGIFCLITLVHIYLPFTLEYWATQHLTSVKIALLYSFSPFATMAIAILLKAEKFGPLKILALIIGLVGSSVATTHGDFSSLIGFNWSLFDLVLLCAIIFSSLAWFLIAKLMSRGVGISLINGASMFATGMLIMSAQFIMSSGKGLLNSNIWSVPREGWLLICSIMLLSNFIGYYLYGKLLKDFSPTFISLSGFLCPLFTFIFSYLLFGAVLDLSFCLSIAIGMLGIFVYSLET